MFICPLCQESWILTTTLCDDCANIRRFMKLYGKEKVIDLTNNILLVKEKGMVVRTEQEIKKID